LGTDLNIQYELNHLPAQAATIAFADKVGNAFQAPFFSNESGL
jgi:hypothetical protein